MILYSLYAIVRRIVPSQFKSLQYRRAANFNGERLIPHTIELFRLLRLTPRLRRCHSITAYPASRRTTKIAVRMALGANRSNRNLLGNEHSPPAGRDHLVAKPLEGVSAGLCTTKK
jgi:hypothetical protein